jgi:hypothetical protein
MSLVFDCPEKVAVWVLPEFWQTDFNQLGVILARILANRFQPIRFKSWGLRGLCLLGCTCSYLEVASSQQDSLIITKMCAWRPSSVDLVSLSFVLREPSSLELVVDILILSQIRKSRPLLSLIERATFLTLSSEIYKVVARLQFDGHVSGNVKYPYLEGRRRKRRTDGDLG